MRIGIFYLTRHGNSPALMRKFFKSMARYPTRVDYIPYIVRKGFPDEPSASLGGKWISPSGRQAECINVNDVGFDLTAYQKAAARVGVDFCMFFNSYTQILASNWLEIYCRAMEMADKPALVGATGSYESFGKHAPFPSVHVRTNAFLIARDTFLSLDQPSQTKLDCQLLESGPDSLSKRIERAGGSLVLVDRHGHISHPQDWPSAHVFYSGRQENLLVSDNRTRLYQAAKLRRRWRLSRAAWGEAAFAAGDSWLKRRILSGVRG